MYKLQKMTIGQASRLPGVICVRRNQFLGHAPRFEGSTYDETGPL